MSIRRLLGTALAMAVAAVALHAVTPDLGAVTVYGLDLQRAVDERGAESLLLGGVAALAWGVWAWGLVGLLLTALSAAPGAAGAVARVVARRVLPAGARRAAAVALGVGLVAGAPLLTACGPGPGAAHAGPVSVHAGPVSASPAAADGRAAVAIPDWPGPVPDWPAMPAAGTPAAAADPVPPAATADPAPTPASPAPAGVTDVPDWPAPAPGSHVVLRGECLWDIASAHLRQHTGGLPSAVEVAAAVSAWWQANAAVIGPDPDVLLPGQVLSPPATP